MCVSIQGGNFCTEIYVFPSNPSLCSPYCICSLCLEVNKHFLPEFIFVFVLLLLFCFVSFVIFVTSQMELGTLDSLTIKILNVVNYINRKPTYAFSFGGFQMQKLKGEEHWDCKEKPKDNFLKIFCSLEYFPKWIVWSFLGCPLHMLSLMCKLIKWLFWWRGIYNTGLGYYWERLTDKYCPLCWRSLRHTAFLTAKKLNLAW